MPPEIQSPPQQAHAHTWQDQTSVHIPTNSLTINTLANTKPQQSQLHAHTPHTHTGEWECNCTQRAESSVLTFLSLFFASFFLSCPPWRPIHTCLLATGAGATVVEERSVWVRREWVILLTTWLDGAHSVISHPGCSPAYSHWWVSECAAYLESRHAVPGLAGRLLKARANI